MMMTMMLTTMKKWIFLMVLQTLKPYRRMSLAHPYSAVALMILEGTLSVSKLQKNSLSSPSQSEMI
eukprot:10147864-Ditylum_brightwellii.AAC.1